MVGYLAELVQPRLAMATHLSFDHEFIGEMIASVRQHYKGLFAFGIDHVVVNATKERIGIREAALPQTTNIARPDNLWMVENNFGGVVPGEMTVKNPVVASQEQSTRDLEVDPARFTPTEQMRPLARTATAETTMNPGADDWHSSLSQPASLETIISDLS